MVTRMPRDPKEERVRLLAVELAGIQEEIDEFAEREQAEALSAPMRRGRIRRVGDRLRGARSRLTATIEEDRA